MAKPAMIRIENLRKTFDDQEILKGIDLEVQETETVVIIGASGSGKSTLLRCINQLEQPTSGQVFLQDREITSKTVNINEIRQEVVMVFQHIHLYPHMNVLRNVTLALRRVQGLSKEAANTRGSDYLARVGLKDKINQYPAQLSGGQQQRVGIARALALQPKVILFDEPTSALDPELVGEVLAVMRQTKDEGLTMLIVTHEMQFAREVADRVIFVNEGKIVEQNTPQELFDNPQHPRLRDFIQRVQH